MLFPKIRLCDKTFSFSHYIIRMVICQRVIFVFGCCRNLKRKNSQARFYFQEVHKPEQWVFSFKIGFVLTLKASQFPQCTPIFGISIQNISGYLYCSPIIIQGKSSYGKSEGRFLPFSPLLFPVLPSCLHAAILGKWCRSCAWLS